MSDNQDIIRVLAAAGYSCRTIGIALGVDQRTVKAQARLGAKADTGLSNGEVAFGSKSLPASLLRRLSQAEPDISPLLLPSYRRFKAMYESTLGRISYDHLKVALPIIGAENLLNWIRREEDRMKAHKKLLDLYLCLKQTQCRSDPSPENSEMGYTIGI